MNTSSTSYNGGGQLHWEINTCTAARQVTLDGAQGLIPAGDFQTSPLAHDRFEQRQSVPM